MGLRAIVPWCRGSRSAWAVDKSVGKALCHVCKLVEHEPLKNVVGLPLDRFLWVCLKFWDFASVVEEDFFMV